MSEWLKDLSLNSDSFFKVSCSFLKEFDCQLLGLIYLSYAPGLNLSLTFGKGKYACILGLLRIEYKLLNVLVEFTKLFL